MIVSHCRAFVYIGPPKTASTSLHQWLSQPLLCEERYNNAPGSQHLADVPPEALEYFTFASVRNPYDRTASLWKHSLRETPLMGTPRIDRLSDFVEWLPCAPWFYTTSQAELLRGVRLDALLKVGDLARVLEFPPIAPLVGQLEPMPWLNSTGGPDRSLYDAATAARVREYFAEDFETFGFSEDWQK